MYCVISNDVPHNLHPPFQNPGSIHDSGFPKSKGLGQNLWIKLNFKTNNLLQTHTSTFGQFDIKILNILKYNIKY